MEVEKKTQVVKNLVETLLMILVSYTAGTPMNSDILWTNLTLLKTAWKNLKFLNIYVHA